MPLLIQPSFAKGVLAPSLHGRVDTAVYHVGLAEGNNIIIHTYGGASHRPGTTFIGPCKEHTYAPRLIPFSFKTTDQYILEFGNLYMRVIRNDGYVTNTAVNITGATAANPVVVTAVAHGFSNSDEVYITGVGGMVQLNGNRYKVANVTANTFELTHQATSSNINGLAFTAYTSGGTVAEIFEIVTQYVTADLDELKFTKSADTMTICHQDYTARDLTRTGHAAWTLSVVSFVPEQDHPIDHTVTVNTAGAETRVYGVTALKFKTFEESLTALNNTDLTITAATAANPVVITAAAHGFLNGDEVEINGVVGMTEINGRRFIVSNKAANTFELLGTNGTGYTAYTSGGIANQTFVKVTTSAVTEDNTIAWDAIAGAEKYAIYRKDNDGLYGLIGETGAVTFEDDNLAPDTSITPPIFNNPLSLTDDTPGTSNYFEQRQVYGGSINSPDTAFYSRVGDRTNHSAASPAAADDAFSATLASNQVNEIRHFVPLNDLIVLTSGSEWKVNSGPDTAFELASIRQKQQSTWGSSHLKPYIVGNAVFYLTDGEQTIRTLGYSFQLDNYTGTDLGLLANHYLKHNNVVDWSLKYSPEIRFFLCRDDGKALTVTFDSEQEVIAWTDWTTDGSFERTASIRHSHIDDEDDIYFVIKRTINANTVRYVEKLHHYENQTPEDAFFLDSGLCFDTPVTLTNITAASPAVVTAASHGFSNGDLVDINGVIWEPDVDEFFTETQPVQAIGRYKVAGVTANTFQLTNEFGVANVDGSTWNAYESGGEVREAVLTFRGLDHLEGETLVANSDGNVIRGIVVSAGAITLTRAASRLHIGMPYTSTMKLLDIESPSSSSTIQGRKIVVNNITIKFEATRGLVVGPSTDLFLEMKQREFERIGEPTRLLTGIKKIHLKPSWKSNGSVTLRQKDPLPFTVLSVVPDIEVGDD